MINLTNLLESQYSENRKRISFQMKVDNYFLPIAIELEEKEEDYEKVDKISLEQLQVIYWNLRLRD